MIFDELARCRPWIEATLQAANEGTHTFDDIAAMVLYGRFLLWSEPDACWLTEIVDTPRKRVLNVPFLGGNLETIKANLPKLEEYAKAQGCAMITGQGRRGWGRALGFEEAHTNFIRSLTHG